MKKIYIIIGLAAIIIVGALLSGKFSPALDQAVQAATPKAPELVGTDQDWLNTPNGKAVHLYGPDGLVSQNLGNSPKLAHHVILIDFWEYTCINCKHVMPYVEDLASRYKSSGLVVIGIHTPEVIYHHAKPYVIRGAEHLGITFPVLLDRSYKNWNAYNNEYWPMEYVMDHTGNIVYSYAGEGNYYTTEQTIRKLLLEANPGEKLPEAMLTTEPN